MGSLWFSGVLPVGRAANASATLVQSFGAQNAGTGSATLSASPTAATTAGDLLVAVIRDRNASALTLVGTVADSNAGDHWAKATSIAQGSQADGEIWYVTNAASLATSQSVTVTVGGTKASTTAIAFTVLDVSGATGVALDGVATKGGSTQPASAGPTATTTQASEIAVADVGWNSGSVTVSGQTTGYTVLPTQQSTVSSTGAGEQAAWRLLSATGTQTYQATISASTAAWTGAIATFKVGSSGPPPVITSFSPPNGVDGTTVTINGTGFTGATAVGFNGTPQTVLTVTGDIKITANVPAGATTGAITVTAPGGLATSATSFTVLPSITTFTPTSGPLGTSVTINGSGFTGLAGVTFTSGAAAATLAFVSDAKVTAIVPAAAANGPITVTAGGNTSAPSTQSFTVTTGPPPPVISNFGPTSGPAGTSVVINGTGFTGASAVKFNTTNQPTFTVTSDSQISTTVPNGATTGPIAVTVAGVTATSSTSFVVNSASNAPHIMVIVEENHSYNGTHGIIGNTSRAPYINSLATTYMSATNYYGQVHGSPPDYQALLAGDMSGSITKPSASLTLVDELATAGISWRAYMETVPSTCDLAGTNDLYGYASDHNPFVYYASTRTQAQCQNVVPYTQFATDANTTTPPAFMFVVPNQCNDMHTTCPPQTDQETEGDLWLQNNLPTIMNSTWYQQGGTVIITWDEAYPTDTTGVNGSSGGHVPTIVVSAATKVGSSHTFSSAGNLYGILRGIEERYGVPLLANTSNAANGDLSGALGPNTVGAISGTVTDSQTPAQPVSGATVSYTGTKGSGSITTTSTGGYTLSGITPGTYTVSASDAGFTSPTGQTVIVTAGTTATANFTLTATSGISGAVSDSQATPQPIGGATVQYTGTGSSTGSGTTTTNTSGGYSFNGAPPGTYTVTASHTGYTSPAAQPVSVTTGVMATANITLAATSGISGTVSDSETPAQPVSGATVTYVGTGATTGGGTTPTGAGGTYMLSGVSPGTYSVTASATSYTSPAAQTVTVNAGAVTSGVNFTLTATSGISGAVTDTQSPSQSVSGATVHYSGTGSTTGSGTTTTNSSGGYTFNGVPPGTYSVSASATGFTSPAAQPVTVIAGGSATANFILTATTGISGLVNDSQTPAQPVSGATVIYTGTGGNTATGTTTTNPSGGYSFSSVSAGTYSVSVTDTGFTTPSAQPVTVTGGSSATANFTMTAPTSISGTVSDSQAPAQPVSGVSVHYAGTGGTTGSGDTTTNSTGAYTFNGVPPGAYSVTVTATGFTSPSAQPVTVTAGTSVSGVNLTLTATSGIGGTVTDSETPAQAVSGATVFYTGTAGTTGSGSTTTGASGTYSLSGVPPGTYSVTASDSGFTSPAAQPVTVTAGAITSGVNFKLTATSAISGTVTDGTLPIPTATVSYSATGGSTGSGSTTAINTTDGSYMLSAVPPGTYTVTASAPGFAPQSVTSVTVTASNTTTGVDFTLTPTTTGAISGTVTDSQTPAQPVSGATVCYYTGVACGVTDPTATTDSSGSYTFSGLTPGTYSVSVSDTGFTSPAAQSVTVAAGSTATVNFTMTATSGVSGTVSDSQTPAQPVSGAAVSYAGTGGTTGSGTTTTDSIGSYTFNGVPPGTYSVTAAKTGFTSPVAQTPTVTSGNTATASFTLTATSGISGAVTDSQTPAQAVSGATVSYTGTGGTTGSGSTTTNSSGGYTFNGVPPGTYSVTATATGFTAPAAQTPTVTAGVTATVNFTLSATSGIGGTVSDSQTPAQPVAGATVSYSGTGGTTGSGTTTTDSTGSYTFNVPPGTYSVTATKTGFTPPVAQTPTVTAGVTATASFTVTATSGISGTVTDSQTPKQPVSVATVTYTGTGGSTGSGTTTTNSSGGYTFNGVPPGTYSVIASHTGFTPPAAQTPTVTTGVTATANFTLTATSGISGTVTDQTSAPVNGATLSYTGTGGTTGSGTTTTNSSGVYALNGVPSGTYSVSSSDTGYTSPSAQAVTVTSGATTSGVNFTLTSSSHQPIFSDGFESGNLSAWTKTQNMTVETTTVHGPTHAVQGVSTSTSTATTAYAQKTLSATYTTSYTRVWFWIVSDSGQQANLLRVRGTTNANTAFVFVSSTGFLSLNNGTAAVKSTTPVTTGAWHELELNVVTGASASTQVWLDGSLVTALTGSGLTNLATPIQTIQIGEAGLQTWTANFDDVAFDTQMIP
jgi:protocatechuate 3,4-dioxygenase beta subunit